MKKRVHYLLIFLTIIGFSYNLISQEKNIEITYKRNEDKSVDINYKKRLPGSYYLKLEFTLLKNCYQSTFKGVIKNNSGNITRLRPINKNEHINFSYKYTTIIGNPNSKVDSLFKYVLPFKKGKKVTIDEATNLGEKYFGSERPVNWKSYIVYSESPDTICNIRKGIVVKITDKYESDTLLEKSYTSQRNRIIIEHADGTYASYTGFKKNSIFAKLGQTVYPQTKLGIIDIFNTGKYRLSIAIYHLIDSNLKNPEKQNLKNKKNRYAFLTPYFITENGTEKLKARKEYTAISNEKILFKEFTKREMKKYKKNPQIFE